MFSIVSVKVRAIPKQTATEQYLVSFDVLAYLRNTPTQPQNLQEMFLNEKSKKR